MKSLLLPFSIFVLVTACDNPQRNRMQYPLNGNSTDGLTSSPASGAWGPGNASGSTSGTTTGETSPSTGTRPPGFENCDITPKYYSAGINYIGVCQSSTDETSVAVKTTVSDTVRTCLIPTYKDASGSSTYLGQPQCFIPEEDKISMGNVYKTRAGFEQNPINGVMVMKEASLGAYFTCMNAVVQFRSPQCPNGAQTNPYCHQMATADMNAKCNDFKSFHSYIDIRLKN